MESVMVMSKPAAPKSEKWMESAAQAKSAWEKQWQAATSEAAKSWSAVSWSKQWPHGA